MSMSILVFGGFALLVAACAFKALLWSRKRANEEKKNKQLKECIAALKAAPSGSESLLRAEIKQLLAKYDQCTVIEAYYQAFDTFLRDAYKAIESAEIDEPISREFLGRYELIVATSAIL